MPIYLANQSTLVSDSDVAAMADACTIQIAQHCAPAWRLTPLSVVAVKPGQVPADGWLIVVMDTIDDADALGYHTEDGHGIHGVVGAKPVLDHGATALTGPYAVSTVVSHEALELFVDPCCNAWSDLGRGYLVSTEVCDPVQDGWYDIPTRDGRKVSVSNYVTPAWFDPQDRHGPYDRLGQVRQPGQITRGGYVVQMREGKPAQRFGAEVPGWLREQKLRRETRVGSLLTGTMPGGQDKPLAAGIMP